MSKNAEGWIRHRGGKAPVSDDVFIDVRYRDGEILKLQKFKKSEAFLWAHHNGCSDIMAYKLHKPAEQVEACSKPDPRDSAKRDSDYVCWMRDRITEIDSTTQALTAERAELAQKLASEGFALIGRINELLTEAAQKHEDMSDWRNWKAGDLVTCVTIEYQDVYTQGRNYAVKEVKAYAARVYDDCGHGIACDLSDSHMDKFKWHSRPSA